MLVIDMYCMQWSIPKRNSRNTWIFTLVQIERDLTPVNPHCIRRLKFYVLVEGTYLQQPVSISGNQSGSVFMREARAKSTPSKSNTSKADTPGKSPKTPGSRGSSNFNTDLEAMKDEVIHLHSTLNL